MRLRALLKATEGRTRAALDKPASGQPQAARGAPRRARKCRPRVDGVQDAQEAENSRLPNTP